MLPLPEFVFVTRIECQTNESSSKSNMKFQNAVLTISLSLSVSNEEANRLIHSDPKIVKRKFIVEI